VPVPAASGPLLNLGHGVGEIPCVLHRFTVAVLDSILAKGTFASVAGLEQLPRKKVSSAE
jgi:hypothetical protein